MNLFTRNSTKINKGKGRGIEGVILYLSPADAAGGPTVCPWSTESCRAVCLGETSGRMVMDGARSARRRRTLMFHHEAPKFWSAIRREIGLVVKRATRKGALPVVRLDGTSDLDLARILRSEFPEVIFYDYTKSARRVHEWLDTGKAGNRWLTFSRSESNEAESLAILARGGDVAVVFGTKKGEALPATWKGYRVIDGDTHDWRFLDKAEGGGVVVGLRAKGAARRDRSGFVVHV